MFSIQSNFKHFHHCLISQQVINPQNLRVTIHAKSIQTQLYPDSPFQLRMTSFEVLLQSSLLVKDTYF